MCDLNNLSLDLICCVTPYLDQSGRIQLGVTNHHFFQAIKIHEQADGDHPHDFSWEICFSHPICLFKIFTYSFFFLEDEKKKKIFDILVSWITPQLTPPNSHVSTIKIIIQFPIKQQDMNLIGFNGWNLDSPYVLCELGASRTHQDGSLIIKTCASKYMIARNKIYDQFRYVEFDRKQLQDLLQANWPNTFVIILEASSTSSKKLWEYKLPIIYQRIQAAKE